MPRAQAGSPLAREPGPATAGTGAAGTLAPWRHTPSMPRLRRPWWTARSPWHPAGWTLRSAPFARWAARRGSWSRGRGRCCGTPMAGSTSTWSAPGARWSSGMDTRGCWPPCARPRSAGSRSARPARTRWRSPRRSCAAWSRWSSCAWSRAAPRPRW